jgi:hypothetical protein
VRTVVLVGVVLLAGCGGSEERVTVYLKQRLGPEGPPGQVAPVLAPVERAARPAIEPGRQVLLALQQGPSPRERVRGFAPTFPPGTWPRRIDVRGETATVDLAGSAPPDLYGAAAAVYSLTELPGVERVRLRFRGAPCCVYRHDGTVVRAVTRRSFRFWQGEPCAARTDATHVRCRGRPRRRHRGPRE